eukprot:scpid38198/ scgid3685/ E3 ubiquitin-protein ligase TRIM33; Ectodermin; Transcription intermediary factor 1-gamma; Tripartite motif-containing protein 33
MSTSKTITSTAKEVEEHLACAICLDRFNDPRMLPCQHTFCFHCLEKLATRSNTASITVVLNCPHCRETHSLPDLSSLPKHRLVVQLIDTLDNAEMCVPEAVDVGEPAVQVCEECDDAGNKVAAGFCSECRIYLCDDCVHYHETSKRFRQHRVTAVQAVSAEGERDQSDKLSVPALLEAMCDKHFGERLELFCESHSVQMCFKCAVLVHKSCTYSSLEDAAGKRAQEIKEAVESLSTAVIEPLQEALLLLQSTGKSMESDCDDVCSLIQQDFTSLRKTLQDYEVLLLQQVKGKDQQDRLDLQKRTGEAAADLNRAQQARLIATSLIENPDRASLVKMAESTLRLTQTAVEEPPASIQHWNWLPSKLSYQGSTMLGAVPALASRPEQVFGDHDAATAAGDVLEVTATGLKEEGNGKTVNYVALCERDTATEQNTGDDDSRTALADLQRQTTSEESPDGGEGGLRSCDSPSDGGCISPARCTGDNHSAAGDANRVQPFVPPIAARGPSECLTIRLPLLVLQEASADVDDGQDNSSADDEEDLDSNLNPDELTERYDGLCIENTETDEYDSDSDNLSDDFDSDGVSVDEESDAESAYLSSEDESNEETLVTSLPDHVQVPCVSPTDVSPTKLNRMDSTSSNSTSLWPTAERARPDRSMPPPTDTQNPAKHSAKKQQRRQATRPASITPAESPTHSEASSSRGSARPRRTRERRRGGGTATRTALRFDSDHQRMDGNAFSQGGPEQAHRHHELGKAAQGTLHGNHSSQRHYGYFEPCRTQAATPAAAGRVPRQAPGQNRGAGRGIRTGRDRRGRTSARADVPETNSMASSEQVCLESGATNIRRGNRARRGPRRGRGRGFWTPDENTQR